MTVLKTKIDAGRGRLFPRSGRSRAIRAGTTTTLVALTLQISMAFAQDPSAAETPAIAAESATPAVDTAKWKCKFCEFEEGWYADVTLGIGQVSEDSSKFGEYNGLQESGSYLIGDAGARYRSEDATYLDLSVADFGLDTRSLAIAGGKQGSYDLSLSYHEIPHYGSAPASTPYLGNGGDVLTLPAGWVRSSTTTGMTALAANLREVELKTERKRLGTGISITTESPWNYELDLRHEDKDGSKLGGGSFLFSSAQLVEPVDYVTDEIDAAVTYTTKQLQGRLAYYVSTFSNNNESLTWENAYSPIVGGADEGQLALPPSNEFQQLTLSIAYQINDRNHLSADIAVGRMLQDERLLQATLNTLLVVPPLPSGTANAEVETTNSRIQLVSMPADKLRLSAAYSHDERDNKTPQSMYDWVSTDTVVASQRSNLPYSYTRDTFKLKADYDYARGTKLGIGYDIDERDRSFQEVDKTSEDTLWGSVRMRGIDTLFFEFKLATSSRDASASEIVAAIDPPQNILLSKYNTADRKRDTFGVFTSFMPSPGYTVGLGFDGAQDDYSGSELGLSDSIDNNVNVDVAALLSETTSINVFLARQRIRSTQTGSQNFAGADWIASTEDTFDNFGIGVTYVVIEDRLDIGADFSVARSTGVVELSSGAPASVFPDLRTDLETFKLYLNYRVDENLSWQAAYWHESYDSNDWALDGVAPDTVANLLGFGLQSPNYTNNVIKLALNYHF
jgi:MtrB/PioB family decaheme-associated outer membrane protein